MTKSILALEFKQCEFDTSVYYFINKEIRELVIVVVYVNNIYFICSKISYFS